MQRVETTTLGLSSCTFMIESLKSMCLLSRPTTSSSEPRKKIGQGPIFADKVAVFLFHVHYFQGRGNLQASETCDLVASNQHQIHPAGPVPENSEKDVNDIKVRAAQGRAIRVTKISVFDQGLAQC